MRARLLLLASIAALAACTFPDVDYADGGTSTGSSTGGSGSSSSTTSSGTGGACPGLDPCTTTAASCSAAAMSQYDACILQCHGSMGCTMKCGTDRTTAETLCATQCQGCAPAGCTGVVAACQKAAGL